MIHRTALEVTAVWQDLLVELLPDQAVGQRQPARGLGTVEVQAREQQCLGVGEQVIAEQMRLEARPQPAGLDREAVGPVGLQGLTAQRPLDPVDDAQRGRVRLPAGAAGGWMVGDPAREQRALPARASVGVDGVQVVEVVQVVAPQPGHGWIVPPDTVDVARLAQEAQRVRTDEAGLASGTADPRSDPWSQGGRRVEHWPRSVQAVPHPPDELLQAQVPERSPVSAGTGHPATGPAASSRSSSTAMRPPVRPSHRGGVAPCFQAPSNRRSR